jgi:hypothetical protein
MSDLRRGHDEIGEETEHAGVATADRSGRRVASTATRSSTGGPAPTPEASSPSRRCPSSAGGTRGQGSRSAATLRPSVVFGPRTAKTPAANPLSTYGSWLRALGRRPRPRRSSLSPAELHTCVNDRRVRVRRPRARIASHRRWSIVEASADRFRPSSILVNLPVAPPHRGSQEIASPLDAWGWGQGGGQQRL